ncbi:hypothetical protein B7P43_G15907 [Cryptotermes secundus]|uniref:Uncharacterized protein n=1 Tax=Cryptotermes secundus TaxID=105785 RepID=A0A2J7PTM6_9NEOP|nr:hypothetical protein B7P43_G15907 [Cryptotermes secundus]
MKHAGNCGGYIINPTHEDRLHSQNINRTKPKQRNIGRRLACKRLYDTCSAHEYRDNTTGCSDKRHDRTVERHYGTTPADTHQDP